RVVAGLDGPAPTREGHRGGRLGGARAAVGDRGALPRAGLHRGMDPGRLSVELGRGERGGALPRVGRSAPLGRNLSMNVGTYVKLDGPIHIDREDGKVVMRFGDMELVFPPELAYRIGEALVLTSHAMMTGTVRTGTRLVKGSPRLEVLRGGKR